MSARRTGPAVDALDHVALTVSDMDRALAFYQGLLGCEVLGQLLLESDTFKLVYLRKGGAYLELFAHRSTPERSDERPAAPGTASTEGGFQHLAFHTDDVDGVAATLEAAGVPFVQPPRDAPGGVRLAFVRDPDGNQVELVSNLPELAPYRSGWR